MNADEKQPLKTAAVGFYARPNVDPECVYDSFSISWQFDTHIVTFENSEIPRPQEDIEGWGVYFLGPNGSLQVNRMGYAVRPYVGKTQRKQGPPRSPVPATFRVSAPSRRPSRVRAGAPGSGGARRPGRSRRPGSGGDSSHREHRRQPQGRGRRGLPARRAHPELPGLREVSEPQDQRVDGNRIQLGAALFARARGHGAEPGAGVGSSGAEIEAGLRQLGQSLGFQFNRTVMGGASSTKVLMRNRCPSRATAYGAALVR